MGPNKREYNSAILAALLHDVGKLLHRGGGEYKGKHEQASAEFIRNFSDQLRNDEFYDLELIAPNAAVTRIVQGKVTIDPEVTR